MKPERWQQLDHLFHSALEREPAQRGAFLAEACAGDESLRRQVEALLAAHEEAGSFIESPAMEVEARGLAADEGTTEAELATGESFSHYRIIAPLGAGGMGQVYLAQDLTLGRKVALKLLPPNFTRDKDRVRRFQQEARAASALNHPNIITIYEIGQVDERHFIATEFIDGATLRERITRSQSRIAADGSRTSGTALQLHEVMNIAMQTADALAAAHEAGIVHRDIKPENIMVRRRDGYVKVLDFGLAKLTEGPSATVDTEAPTRAQIQTDAGVVMGTANYMSPEQARGQVADGRTDIFSLGVVLYEMVAGCAPFEGETPTDVVASILGREPPPLARYCRDVPEALEWITTKALAKDKEERYQTAKEIEVDLRRLKQRLEFAAELERSAPPAANREATEKTSEGGSAVNTLPESTTLTEQVEAHPTSSAEYLVSQIKRHKAGAMIVLATLVIATAGIAFLVYRFAGQTKPSVKPSFQTMRITRLTSNGKAADAAISPDAKYVIHVVDEGGKQSLWMRQVATSSNVQITPPADVVYNGLTFSRDGNYIYYLTDALYRMPALGGTARKLIADVDSPITFSPDGKLVAFVRGYVSQGEDVLIVANADGTAERKLATRKAPDSFFFEWRVVGPAWSPDSKVIACGAGSSDTSGHYMTVVEVRVADGAVRPITSRRWWRVGQMAWLADGSGLIVVAKEQASSPFQIWRLTYADGDARRITNDVNDYRSVTLTADSTTLATVQSDQLSNVWIAPNGEASSAKQITYGKYNGEKGISWAPDSRIVYTSSESGNPDIWIMDQDGSDRKQLTTDTSADLSPSVSPDGRYIIFLSDRTNANHIWRIDLDGGNPKQLTSSGEVQWPYCSPDAQWVIYTDISNMRLWKVPMDGGNPVQLTDKTTARPDISPDGKLISCGYFDEQASTWRLAIIPFGGGGSSTQIFDFPPNFDYAGGVARWTSDGQAMTLIVTSRGISNVWSLPIDGRPLKQLTDFKADRIFSFAWSRDGKQLALARGTLTNDVVLISDFKDQQ